MVILSSFVWFVVALTVMPSQTFPRPPFQPLHGVGDYGRQFLQLGLEHASDCPFSRWPLSVL